MTTYIKPRLRPIRTPEGVVWVRRAAHLGGVGKTMGEAWADLCERWARDTRTRRWLGLPQRVSLELNKTVR